MKIYVNAGLDAPAEALLAAGLVGHEVVRGPATASILEAGADEDLRDCDIAFGQPDPRALAGSALRFVQLTSAGWARYDVPELEATLKARGTILSNASSVFAAPVAEHAIAMMLSLSREIPRALDEQRGSRGWPSIAARASARTLHGEVVLILGYGSIARAMVERLRPFGVELIGYRRHVRGDETIPTVDRSGLDAAWARADHIVNVLPEGRETERFVDAHRFSRCKAGARFYNLGRGSTVDQDALLGAMDRLDAAYLDVTTPEPLPPDHPLWTTPRVFITPHVGGGHRGEASSLVRHFLANLRAFAARTDVLDRVV